ncbi:MAG: 3-hydroxyacyl-CoA dehydrogenase/enoyl-CoA hydratase/carnithine racemase [Actinomycetes bacterium]|jgi:3-hydroxyacyl-CoA dehydrogenase/enoyl-CoA hydratase/carnithine racemase
MTENPTVPDEVVTKAIVRYLDLPGAAGTAAMITLDNGFDHTKPNTFGPGGLAAIDAAIDEVSARTDLSAVCLTGKPFIFAVGADLSAVPHAKSRDDALSLGKEGHRVFNRLSELSVPTFAFVNGAAMGGGLEIALHCQYRTVSEGAAAIALPECFLGLIPGWGGAYLLPNLIGAQNAVKVIVENPLSQNRMLKPKQALDLGIFDEMFAPADYLELSLFWAAGIIMGERTVDRAEIDRGDAWDAAVTAGRELVKDKVGSAAPAPGRALDLIELAKTGTKETGYAAEDEALADLVMSEELRSGLYAFDLVQKRARRPVGVPDKSLAREVNKVGVVGAGLMAGQMALLFARSLLVPVVMTDLDQERVDKGVSYAHGEIDKLATKGRLNGDKANRLKGLISGSVSKEAFSDADWVIEAVFEDLKVKQQVFAEVEAVVSPECILATNTSSLSVTEIASKLAHPERVVGFHFFNPVAIMPLVEIVRAEQTDDATLATAFVVGKKLRKSCVLVKDAPAFVVNRLLTRFMGEVTRSVDEGTSFEIADNALDPLGLPMTPFVLMSLVGPAVAFHVSETMKEAFPDRFYVSENLKRFVDAKKTAIWSWDGGTQHVDPEVAALFVQGDSPLTDEQVRARALDSMAEEIQLMLDEGVVAEAQDIDLCMIMGAGWPFHLGGITPYLDREGVSERVNGKRFLPLGVASVPA